jgi:hypothetical protein
LGWFIFTNLPQNDDYLVALDENDSHLIGKKSYAEFKDNNGKLLKSKVVGGKYLLANTKTSVKFKTNPKNATIVSTNNENTVPKDVPHEQLASVNKLNFEMYFKYNVTQIDVNDGPFKQYIDNLAELAAKNGSININLTSCASQVPTRAYKTNKELSIARSEKAKEQILNALKEKGIDASKVVFVKTKSFVSGPKYNIDYLINKAQYEKHQFIKIAAY